MSRLFEAEVFVAVIDKGSFTAAAAQLGITTSYASKLVTKLEDRLGVRLLHRSTRKLGLTDLGRAYYERCTEVMRALEEAETAATELQRSPRGRLTITLPTVFGGTYLTDPLIELRSRYPDLALSVTLTDRYVDLVAEGFDVAIRAGELRDSSLIAVRLATADVILCASRDYLAARGTPNEPEDLADHECLIYAYNTDPGTWTLKGSRGQASVEVSGSFTANNAKLLLEAACRGLGVIFMPAFHVAPYLCDGRLVRVLPAWQKHAPVPIHAVFPASRHLSAKVRVFVDFMVERFRVPPWCALPA